MAMKRLEAKDCVFCDYYTVEVKPLNGFLGEITKRGCVKHQRWVPDFEIGQGRECYVRRLDEETEK